VIGIVGKWLVDDKPATLGATVDRQTSLTRNPRPNTFGSITIMIGGRRVTYSCDDRKWKNFGCNSPISLATADEIAQEQDQSPNRLMAAIGILFANRPEAYVSAVSRDVGTLEDAVVKTEDSGVDLKPALGSLSQGEYQVIIQKLDSKSLGMPNQGAETKAGAETKITWDPASGKAEGMPQLPFGLVQIHLDTLDGESVGDVWVLVVGPQDFASKTASFEEVKKTTERWSVNVPPAGLHGLQRAALDELSREH
jgi:hypothetical protein